MDPTDNLHSLNKREEELRSESLAAFEKQADLRDHWEIVAEAMNAIYAFAHDHEHSSDNELRALATRARPALELRGG